MAISPTHRAFAIGFLTNGALAAFKLGVGFATGSRALVADGTHSLADVVTNAGAWWAHRIARSPPDEDHHYGHGPVEALAGALVGLALMGGGVGVILATWRADAELERGARGWVALAAAAISIGTNVALARMSHRAARRGRSQGLRALARDNASDALSGGLVFLGIGATMLGLGWAEPAAAFAVGGLIVAMGYRSLREGADVLMDRVDDPGLRERLAEVARGVEGVRGVQALRVHPLGPYQRIDMEISVDGRLSVIEGHAIAHAVERAIREGAADVEEVQVHVNPHERVP